MTSPVRLRAAPFLLAVLVAVAVVLSAPFMGQLRAWLRATFPGNFVLIVGAIGATILLAALVSAARRIRERRAQRYGAIVAALGIATVYSAWNAGTNPESNAVERFHFLEYGLISFLFYRAWRPLGDVSIVLLPTLAGLIVGTAEEWLQWFIPNRVGEINDIFLNLVAIFCGLMFSLAVLPPERFSWSLRASAPRVARLAAVTVLAVAVFVHVLHFGYTIADDEAGTFMSRYTGAELAAIQAEKAAEWRTNPPPLVLQRLSREDQYLSEGLAHVRLRNMAWAAGDYAAAWCENRILEKHFVPVLDTPTYAGPSGHRWPVEQRADAEARMKSGGPVTYTSPYPYRILTWNRTRFWSAVVAAIAALLIVASRARGYLASGVTRATP
jgi:hypothetical protein